MCRVVEFAPLVNKVMWLELSSELKSEALPATTIDFSGIWTHGCVFHQLQLGMEHQERVSLDAP